MCLVVPDLVSKAYFSVLAAEELGLYSTEGLEAHVEPVPPAPRAVGALRDGSLDIVAGPAHAALTLVKHGLPFCDATISEEAVADMHHLTATIGQLTAPVPGVEAL